MDRVSLVNPRREPDYYSMHAPAAEQLAAILIAYVIADLVVAFVVHGGVRSEAAGVFVVSVIGSQAILLALWLGLGNPPLPVRVVLVLAGHLPLLGIFAAEGQLNREFLAGTGFIVLAAAAPYGLLKLFGFRLVRYDYLFRQIVERGSRPPVEQFFPQLGHTEWQRLQASRESEGAHGGEPGNPSADEGRASVQFSIVQIFGWMILVGVMATLARLARMPLDAVFPMGVALSVGTAFGLVTLWAVLAGETVGAALLVPFSAVVVTSVVLTGFMGAGQAFVYIFSTLLITTGLITAALGVFRSAGYRLRRVRDASGNLSHADKNGSPPPTDPWSEEARHVRMPP